jgi:hypothetical protein
LVIKFTHICGEHLAATDAQRIATNRELDILVQTLSDGFGISGRAAEHYIAEVLSRDDPALFLASRATH